MSNTMKVRYSKYFVSGGMKGLTVDASVSVANLERANDFMRFCHAHAKTPVDAIGGSNYIIFGATIVSGERA